MIMMPYAWILGIAAAHRSDRLLATTDPRRGASSARWSLSVRSAPRRGPRQKPPAKVRDQAGLCSAAVIHTSTAPLIHSYPRA